MIHNDPKALDDFTIIITVNMSEEETLYLSCQYPTKTLFAVKSIGLVGMFSIQAPEHTIIESHPENAIDLRLSCPFQELVEHTASFDLDSLDKTDHAHVPFVIILLKFVEVYKAQYGDVPQSYQDRKKLIEMIHLGMRDPDEENFHEAVSHVWRLASGSHVKTNKQTNKKSMLTFLDSLCFLNKVPSEVRQIFDSPSCQDANENVRERDKNVKLRCLLNYSRLIFGFWLELYAILLKMKDKVSFRFLESYPT